MKIPLLQIDAFSSEVLRGNPAAVMPLDSWLEDDRLVAIAAENALSETAFLVPATAAERAEFDVHLRWFTPEAEVDLCGHATLAAAHALLEEALLGAELANLKRLRFRSKSGVLTVTRGRMQDGRRGLTLDFPARPGEVIEPPEGLAGILGAEPQEVLGSRDLLAIFAREEEILALAPDLPALARLPFLGVIASAPARQGSETDFVSRFFAPAVGVPEDPVTGSAHCTSVPYWAKKLGRDRLRARQVSARGGELHAEQAGDRVLLTGQAVTYLRGQVQL